MQALAGLDGLSIFVIILGLVKDVVLVLLFLQGIRLVNFIIKNKGLSVINIIEKDNSLNKTIKENLKEDILYAAKEDLIEEEIERIEEIEKEIEEINNDIES